VKIEINEKISWVGKIDFELRKFHGDQIATESGSSYNSYLIKDEKNILVDLVYKPFAKEFISNLQKEIELSKIDFIIVNHSEPDHSGALPDLMDLIPNTPIICTASGAKAIQGQYHKNWDFKIVKNGEKLNIGSQDILFIEAPMMHWPDTMMCYLTKDGVLFSSDVFGQHFANPAMFDDLSDKCNLIAESEKYYANIISPFSKKTAKKLNELKSMNLNIRTICPAHGIIWRNNPNQIVDLYEKWVSSYQENQITILYDSMYGNTKQIAENIAIGIQSVDANVVVKVLNVSKTDGSNIITDVFKSKGILVGSSAINNGILNSVAGLLQEICNLAPENKKAGTFGSFGWSAKPIENINEVLAKAGYNVFPEVFKVQWSPDEAVLKNAQEFGINFFKF
jgi:flavorubredoxin